ncbi:hypothetical protein TNCV_1191731 [Trichonephila clavipes]|nr:hypothetical protein TNCV_1191731 [Trichonephila clavipes]
MAEAVESWTRVLVSLNTRDSKLSRKGAVEVWRVGVISDGIHFTENRFKIRMSDSDSQGVASKCVFKETQI